MLHLANGNLKHCSNAQTGNGTSSVVVASNMKSHPLERVGNSQHLSVKFGCYMGLEGGGVAIPFILVIMNVGNWLSITWAG